MMKIVPWTDQDVTPLGLLRTPPDTQWVDESNLRLNSHEGNRLRLTWSNQSVGRAGTVSTPRYRFLNCSDGEQLLIAGTESVSES
ncbi:hypothetical protein PQR33_46285, partial [Paraburkholderia sediminicola]|uniref:hypothetical protein n=1 Tax=Paraburkholderia sediminicola TaxID=458836 RepID=UPI0038B6E271